MVSYYRRLLGVKHRSIWLSFGVYKIASSRAGSLYIIRSCPRRRGFFSAKEKCYSKSSRFRHQRRLLFKIFRRPQERQRHQTNLGLEKTKYLPPSAKVPHGHLGIDNPPVEKGQLVSRHRLKGCLFSYNDTSLPSQVPQIPFSRHHLPVSGPPLRPGHSSQNLYQMYGARSSVLTSKRCSSIPVHRRLVNSLHIQTPRSERQNVCATCSTRPRSYREHQKVSPSPIPGRQLHRGEDRCQKRTHLSTTRAHTKNTPGNPEVSTGSNSHSKTRPASPRSDGLNDPRTGSRQIETQVPTSVVSVTIQPRDGLSAQTASSHQGVSSTTPMVGFHSAFGNRTPISTAPAVGTGDHRCEPHRLGCALWSSQDTLPVDSAGEDTAHQPLGNPSHFQGFQDVSTSGTRSGCPSSDGQHHGLVLCEQARGHAFTVATSHHRDVLGVVLPPSCLPRGDTYCLGGQHNGGQSQPPYQPDARVATRQQDLPTHLPPLGHSSHGCFCNNTQPKVSCLRLQSGQGCGVVGRRVHGQLGRRSRIPVSTLSSYSKNISQDQGRGGGGHSDSTPLAPSTVVPHIVADVHRCSPTSSFSGASDTTCRQDAPSGSGHAASPRVEDIPQIQEILAMSKKPSTMKLYTYKWQSFLKFTASRGLVPSPTTLSTLLQFLRYLFDFNLSIPTLKVYIAAVVSFQPRGSSASRLFSHPTVKAFLKGLANLRPPVRPPVPQWSLQLVLRALTRPPFEPMAHCDLKLLALKTLFLVAITSARRASELAALRVDQPFLQFFREKVVLHTDVSFLPKVVSQFHLNQPIILPTLFPNPSNDTERMLHTLDVRRALAFYVFRSKEYRLSNRLFLCYFGCKKGLPASPSTLSRWLVSTISLAYELMHKDPPEGLRAHSTRAVASSTALLRGIDVPDICRTATWSNISTFVDHYRLDVRAKKEASFGRAVLTSVLQ